MLPTKATAKMPVKGIAVKAGKSKNNIVYTPENLMATAHELSDKPILKDHKALTDNVIGRTTSASFQGDSIIFQGWVKDEATGEKIADGRIKEVSIGAVVERLVKESEDSDALIAEGIHYLELSTTPTPGVAGTSISAEAMDERLDDDTMNIIKQAMKPALKPVTEETPMEEPKTIPLAEYEKLQSELQNVRNARKQELMNELCMINTSLREKAMTFSESELKMMIEYEKRLAVKAEAVPKAEVQQESKKSIVENVIKTAADNSKVREAARIPGTVIIEQTGNGKVSFWKAPDYSKMGWKPRRGEQ